jgi:hypothetical protein
MNPIRIAFGALLFALVLTDPARSQTEDVFAFVPAGGRTLLIEVLESKPSAEEVRGMLTGRRTRDEWTSYLKGRSGAVPALAKLSDRERLTLADYLSFHMPVPAGNLPADLGKANWSKVLPQDGRDLVLNFCQFCHIITVVVTQDRPQEHWLGTLNKPSHVEIELSPRQREELASYLVINGGIPVDDVPVELRAGGASY